MIKRLLIVFSVIIGVPLYFCLNKILLDALFPGVFGWPGSIAMGFLPTPLAIEIVLFVLYGIAKLIYWIATGKDFDEIDWERIRRHREMIPDETNEDMSEAIQELDKEFPGVQT